MFFTYIVLSISMYSLQRQKPQVVEVSPVVNVEAVKSKPKKSEQTILDSDEINQDLEDSETSEIDDENNIQSQEIENPEEIENYDPELYEEITFEDNFDKEYRDDVGDSYFEDTEETTIPDSSESSENIENMWE